MGDRYAELEVRQSTASRWAHSLVGFEPTEAEWWAVAKLKYESASKAAASETQRGEGRNLAMMERYGLIPQSLAHAGRADDPNADLEAAIQQVLGPERYALYERGGDSNYQQTRRVTRRLDLPDDVAGQTWQVQRLTREAAQAVRANPGLTEPGRQTALADLALEATRTLRDALGPQGFEVYLEHAGDWLNRMVPRK